MEQQDVVVTETRLDVGAMLREAREKGSMTVEDVAVRLKFAPRQIVALEENDFKQLPEAAFVRGFVRSYAKLLQLDAEPLLAALPGGQAALKPMEKQAAYPGIEDSRKSNLYWLAGALVVLCLLVVLAWNRDDHAPGVQQQPVVAPSVSADMNMASAPEAAAPAVEDEKPAAAKPLQAKKEVAQAAPAAASEKKPPVLVKPQPSASTQQAARAVESVASQAGSAASAAAPMGSVVHVHRPEAILRMVFDEDSWAEVKDSEGNTRTSYLYLQGSEQSLNPSLPMTVVLGNAKGVRLYFKGKPLDLTPHIHAGVARLTLE